MACPSNKVDSNITGLRVADEECTGKLPDIGVIWKPLEPNGYPDFGGQISTVARNPINPSRQRKKGVVTDLDASAGLSTDFTQEGQQDMMEAFLYADARRKDELTTPVIDGANDEYEPAAGGDGYLAGDLLFAKQFSDPAANGLKTVTGTPTATAIGVVESIPALTGQTGIISRVGFRFATGDAEINVSGTLPALTATVKNLTQLGLIPGEWVFIGGDTAVTTFAGTTNGGFARIRSVNAGSITFDKTDKTFTTDAGTGKTIRIFFGRVIKNELGALIKQLPKQFERTLGAPDQDKPDELQAEYMIGCLANEFSISISTASKIEMDMSFVCTNSERRSAGPPGVPNATIGVKEGARPALIESEAFNTSSDISRVRLAKVDALNPAPTPLFMFAEEIALTLNNGVTPIKAVGTLGNIDSSIGTLEMGGSLTALFSTVEAVDAVNNNEDMTLDLAIVKNNQGFLMDLPLITLGDGKPTVEQDNPIKLPLTMDAASGAKVSPDLDYTLMVIYFDYLPDVAA